jgi:hypothetical protein
MKYEDMVRALFEQAETLAAAMSLDISFPDLKTDTPTDTAYLEVTHFPNRPTNYARSGTVGELRGILQIAYIDPGQRGEIQATIKCTQIADAFGIGTALVKNETVVQIYEKPQIGGVLQDGHKAIYPVSIRYRCS